MHSPPVQPISSSSVGHRLGEDDVGGGDREPAAQRPAQALRGAADRQHRRAGPHRAARGARLDPVRAVAAARRTGEDSKTSTPLRPQPLAQAERQARRLHRRRVGVEDAAAEGRRGAARGDLARGRAPATASASPSSRQAASASAETPSWAGGGRDLEVAGAAEPGVDSLRLAEVPDPADRVARPRGRPPAPRSAPQRRACSAARATSRCRSRRCARSARARSARRPRAGRPAPRAPAASGARPPTSPCSRRRPRPRRRRARRRSGGGGLDRPGLLQPVAVRRVLHRLKCPRSAGVGGRRLESMAGRRARTRLPTSTRCSPTPPATPAASTSPATRAAPAPTRRCASWSARSACATTSPRSPRASTSAPSRPRSSRRSSSPPRPGARGAPGSWSTAPRRATTRSAWRWRTAATGWSCSATSTPRDRRARALRHAADLRRAGARPRARASPTA